VRIGLGRERSSSYKFSGKTPGKRAANLFTSLPGAARARSEYKLPVFFYWILQMVCTVAYPRRADTEKYKRRC